MINLETYPFRHHLSVLKLNENYVACTLMEKVCKVVLNVDYNGAAEEMGGRRDSSITKKKKR
jgi:hypothetical protein